MPISAITDSPPDQPEEQLRLFIETMEKWESESWKAMKAAERTASPKSYEEAARQLLVSIFQKFCTPKKRTYGRVDNLSLAQPSDYCSQNLVLAARESSPRRAVFVATSARRGWASKWVFVLLKQGGRWLVDNKKGISDDGSESSWWL